MAVKGLSLYNYRLHSLPLFTKLPSRFVPCTWREHCVCAHFKLEIKIDTKTSLKRHQYNRPSRKICEAKLSLFPTFSRSVSRSVRAGGHVRPWLTEFIVPCLYVWGPLTEFIVPCLDVWGPLTEFIVPCLDVWGPLTEFIVPCLDVWGPSTRSGLD